MKKKLLIIAGGILVLTAFVFLAWKQGIFTLPGEPQMVSTTGNPPPAADVGKCWDDGKWYNGYDNFLKDDGCTVCVCNGQQRTVYCTTNTERPDCVAAAAQY